MTKHSYDLYLNTPKIGKVLAAECVLVETDDRLGRIGFRYTEEYLNNVHAFPLDPIHLPLTKNVIEFHPEGALPGFLDDYLPDDWGRRVLAYQTFFQQKRPLKNRHLSTTDLLNLLTPNRIGAIGIVSKGLSFDYAYGAPVEAMKRAEKAAQALDQPELAQEIDELSLLYLANNGTGVGGARPKALIHDKETCYIAKFNRRHSDPFNNARVELACLIMAKHAGIDVPNAHVHSGVNRREVLLVERFDVVPNDFRAHLVSMNSLLKATVTCRNMNNVFRYNDIHDIVIRHSVNIERDLEQLVRVMLFNRAINNTDDHERNFSLINRGDGYQLSPAYDMVPSLTRGSYHAAGFNYSPYPPTLSEARTLGKVFGLSKPKMKRIIDDILGSINKWPAFAKEAGLSVKESKQIETVFNP